MADAKDKEGRCALGRCSGNPSVFYHGVRVCDACWVDLARLPEEERLRRLGAGPEERKKSWVVDAPTG